MDYNIYSKDVTVTDSMKDYIDKRFSKVSKVVNEEKLISMISGSRRKELLQDRSDRPPARCHGSCRGEGQ